MTTSKMFFGLSDYNKSITRNNPDVTLHEIGKFCNLALKCNPTVMELLWLEEYDKLHQIGKTLIDMRKCFLSSTYVKNAYFGYAHQQFKKLENRNDGSFSSDLRKRTEKHARHLVRLVQQGKHLYLTGNLIVRVEDPKWIIAFGEDVAAGNVDRARRYLQSAEEEIKYTYSPLPDKPETQLVNSIVSSLRFNWYVNRGLYDQNG